MADERLERLSAQLGKPWEANAIAEFVRGELAAIAADSAAADAPARRELDRFYRITWPDQETADDFERLILPVLRRWGASPLVVLRESPSAT